MPPKLKLDASVFSAPAKPVSQRATVEIIDGHIHLFPEQILKHCQWWMKGFEGSAAISKEAHPVERYRDSVLPGLPTATAFKGFVYIQTEVEHSEGNWQNALDEIEYVSTLNKTGECPILGLVSWAPVNEGAQSMREFLDKVQKLPNFSKYPKLLKGIRTPFLWSEPKKDLTDATVIESLKLLGERGLTFDFCISETHHPGVLSAVIDCITKVRDGQPEGKQTRFVVDHICNFDIQQALQPEKTVYETFLAALNELALIPDVSIKLSAAIGSIEQSMLQVAFKNFQANPQTPSAARKEISNQLRLLFTPVLDAFGLERVFYGSDWPVTKTKLFPDQDTVSAELDKQAYAFSLSVYFDTLRSMGLGNDDLQEIFYNSSKRFYGI